MKKLFSEETQAMIDRCAMLTGRPTETDPQPQPLAWMVNRLDEVHADLPTLLQDPGLDDHDYEHLWKAHEHISKALAIMVRVKRRGNLK